MSHLNFLVTQEIKSISQETDLFRIKTEVLYYLSQQESPTNNLITIFNTKFISGNSE